jgi:hypothetical protein
LVVAFFFADGRPGTDAGGLKKLGRQKIYLCPVYGSGCGPGTSDVAAAPTLQNT